MNIRLPYFKHPAESAGINAVIENSARAAGIREDQMAIYMTHFFEALADEVSRGAIVSVPGFGKFAACLVKHPRTTARMRPRFSAHRGFRHQTVLCAPFSTKGNRALKIHEGNHCSDNDRKRSRPFIEMERVRACIRNQMAGG